MHRPFTVPSFIHTPIHILDEQLWRRGFKDPRLRGVARRGVLATALAFCIGIPLAFFSPFLFWFGVGSLLAVWNFCALTRWVAKILPSGWSSGTLTALLVHTNIRLFITGICLYISIVSCKAPVLALLTGLTVIVFDVTVTGLWAVIRKSHSRPRDIVCQTAPTGAAGSGASDENREKKQADADK